MPSVLRSFCKLQQFLFGMSQFNALSDKNQRFSEALIIFTGLLDQGQIEFGMGLVASQIDARLIAIIELLDLCILRNINEHRTRTTTAGNVESPGNRSSGSSVLA